MNITRASPDLFFVVFGFLPDIRDINQFKRISPVHSNIAHKCVTAITTDEGVCFDDIRGFKRLKNLQLKYIEAFSQDEVAEAIKFVALNKFPRVTIYQFDPLPFGGRIRILQEKWKLDDAIKIEPVLNNVEVLTAIAPLCDATEPSKWEDALKNAIFLGLCDSANYIASTGNIKDWTKVMIAALQRGHDGIINTVESHFGGKIDWNFVLMTARRLQITHPKMLTLAEGIFARQKM